MKIVDWFLYHIWFKLWLELFDNGLCYVMPTTNVKKHDATYLKYLKAFPWLLLGIFMTPIGTMSYIIWFIVFRKLLRFENFQRSTDLSCSESPGDHNLNRVEDKKFEILSINVCLLPETLSRENNLCFTETRLSSIGSLINRSIPNTFCFTMFPKQDFNIEFDSIKIDKAKKLSEIKGKVIHENMKVNVVDDFIAETDVDFVCMQEVWSIDTANKLRKLLHLKYPFIVYDAGTKNFSENKYVGFESGLLTASKYPIVAADFHQFSNKSGLCTYTSKGLLITKVFWLFFVWLIIIQVALIFVLFCSYCLEELKMDFLL